MIPRNRSPVEEEDPFDFPDLPDSFSDQNQSSRTPSSSFPAASTPSLANPSHARRNLHSTVLGSGPNGIGIITKLNTKSKPSTISHGSIKLKNKAIAKTWEDELDFEGDWGGTLKLKAGGANKVAKAVGEEMDGFDDDDEGNGGDWKEKLKVKSGLGKLGIGLGMPIRKIMPAADALDDIDFDLDDGTPLEKGTEQKKDMAATITKPNKFFVRPPPSSHLPGPEALDDLDVFDFNEDEATIKAGPALKALLPPPRIRPTTLESTKDKDDMDIDMDDDFALPLNLTNLTLATRSAPGPGTGRHGRVSIASTNTDWNSPTSDRREGWESTPPSKRFSETSATSLSDGLNSLAKNTTSESVLPATPSSQMEEEDMEDGLVLPSKHFFKSTSKRELDLLLDRKRRPEYASPTRTGTVRGYGHMADMTLNSDGLEDGLVFEDPKAELTRKRLTKSKEARSQIPIPTRRSPNGKPLAMGGRDSPMKYPVRERTQSTVGTGLGHRSHSTGNTALLGSSVIPSSSGSGFKPFSPTRPRSPTLLSPAREKERSRSGQAFVPMRIPIPTPQQPKTPPKSGSGLRHQKSSSHLQTSPTHSGLIRKQSLSSLQDPPSGLPLPAFSPVSSLQSLTEEPSTKYGYATTSTSRLTNPTSASKAKTRPPLHGVFPPSSSGKISGLPAPSNAGSSSSTRSRLLHAQMKRRPYGDGTELEAIEDLEVGAEDDRVSWKGSGSGRSKGSVRDRPSLRSVFSPEKEKKLKSVISNSGQTPKGKGRESEIRDGSKDGSWGRRKTKRTPLLIKHLGAVDKRKVVGDMIWNPTALRWEGNESALQDFDHVPIPSSARPALITHTDLDLDHTATKKDGNTSPTSHHTAAGTVRIVGNMQFDPKEMRWISIDPEDEIDPFGDIDFDMADDEDEERGGTIRANGRIFRQDLASVSESDASSTRHVSGVSSISGHGGVSEELKLECKMAEERHRREMRGWVGGTGGSWSRAEERREEKRLWEIRHLAKVVGG